MSSRKLFLGVAALFGFRDQSICFGVDKDELQVVIPSRLLLSAFIHHFAFYTSGLHTTIQMCIISSDHVCIWS